MQRDDANRLRERWGKRECHHPSCSREFDQGQPTGNHICDQCGAVLTPEEVEQIKARHDQR